jgi:hypothetical protein
VARLSAGLVASLVYHPAVYLLDLPLLSYCHLLQPSMLPLAMVLLVAMSPYPLERVLLEAA